MPENKYQILLTNDDGIESPGLWAAAESLSEVGYVWVAAPREQSSGAGRSMPVDSDGRITPQKLTVHGKEWTVYAVGGTPAQTVQHAILEILDQPPDLVVSGINYGINVGTGITVSGTVGAALEGAAHGIPSLAVSLDTDRSYYLSYSREIDFSAAGHFTKQFARLLLETSLDPDVQVLKIDIPADATPETPWEVTRLSTVPFYLPLAPQRESWDEPKSVDYNLQMDTSVFPDGTDVHAVLVKGAISVTPLTLDLTSRVSLDELAKALRARTEQAEREE